MTRRVDGMTSSLNQVCRQAFVIAHKEDISPLVNSLVREGFSVREVCGPYTPEQLRYSAICRCFVNHANAWKLVVESGVHSVIVEADFVPVVGFGLLPLPVPPDQVQRSLAYLYAVGPQFWDLASSPSCARGHAGGGVAYAISPAVARLMLEFFDEKNRANPSGDYYPWDAEIGYWLKARGVQSFLPYRQFGEHGGIANPEHAKAGLGRPHQADALAGPLPFLPMYAKGSLIRFLRVRLRARAWGLIRLLAGRSLAWHDLVRTEPLRMINFAVGRLLTQPHCHRFW